MKWIVNLTFRQIFYLLSGAALMVFAIIDRDILAGAFSILFLIQGIFDICIFGTCHIPKKYERA
ncbi:MAG: hypothetical protein EPN37_15960 [Chitinophagaceae bacterium]|nr:MAG: hypothetical protein EPN37_15960 [Chitinophagaceae bacterium]